MFNSMEDRLAQAWLSRYHLMNTANAIGFFLLGAVMLVLPAIGGSGASLDAQTTQTLWLQLMGIVTGFIGTGYLLRTATLEASTLLSRVALRRAEAREQRLRAATTRTMPLGVRVTF